MPVFSHVCRSHYSANLLHRVQIRTETAVHGEDFLVDNGGDWKTVETVGKGLPKLDVVPPLALIVKSVDTVDGGTFVIAAEDEEVFWVLDLVRKKQAYRLQGLLASVYVVSEE